MRMKNTALLTGPYDWDPEFLPLAEFEARLAAVRRVLVECGASALLVHGHSVEHGALAYLTGFVPNWDRLSHSCHRPAQSESSRQAVPE